MIPKVSIIMTAHNRERYIGKAIESVLAQTYADFDLLISDDGSTDRTFAIASDYARQDNRIRLATYDHRGPAKALKEAVADTLGPYLCWVDSDDMLEPTALEETVAVLDSDPSIGVVYTDYRVIDANDAVKGYGRRCRIPYSKDRLLLDFMTFHFRLMRRSVYDQVGTIDDTLEPAEDYDLCLKLSEITEFKHLAKPLYRYRIHGQNLSQQQRIKQIECSKTAVSKALERRGLADRLELHVEIREKFILRSKRQP
jgi:glycosyltransferase involved in cell wall biosynthesis